SCVFDRAYPEALPTICFRRGIHTGVRAFPFRDYAPRKGDPVQLPGWQPVPEHQTTLAEGLLEAGYQTALITDNFHLFKPSMNFARGFTQWDLVRGQVVDLYRGPHPDLERNLDRFVVDEIRGTAAMEMLLQFSANNRGRFREEDWTPAQVFLRAADWLATYRDGGKFFLCIDSFDPHEPWDPPREYVERYDPGYAGKAVIQPVYGASSYLSPAELNHVRALYAGEVTLVDRWFGYFMDKLDALGLARDTLVVVVSDHGICIGEHGLMGKLPWGMYPEVMDLVLMIRHPDGLGAGRRVSSFAYQIDAVATMLEAAGVGGEGLDGVSLLPVMAGRPGAARTHATSIFLDYVWARNDRHWFIERNDGRVRFLYDLDLDRRFETNLALTRPDLADEMHRRILADAGGEVPIYPPIPVSALGASWYRRFQMDLRRGAPQPNV
ncbi:MAG: sulfatase, partial [Armatimonadetes bacterium]|nr:sulfatase [Armatimonadota bacterium]